MQPLVETGCVGEYLADLVERHRCANFHDRFQLEDSLSCTLLLLGLDKILEQHGDGACHRQSCGQGDLKTQLGPSHFDFDRFRSYV